MDEGFKININKFNSSEKLIALIRMTHPDLDIPITIVDDKKEIVFEGETYLPFPFRLKLNDQVEGQLPRASLIIPNMSSQIAKWVDMTLGARDAVVEVIVTRRSSLKRDHFAQFEVDKATINPQIITFSLSVQNNLVKRAIRWTYDRTHAPSLF